jgi:hypothetical protein
LDSTFMALRVRFRAVVIPLSSMSRDEKELFPYIMMPAQPQMLVSQSRV